MACMYGRCRRVVGVCMALVYGVQACVGTVLWRVYGVCVRCAGVGCTYG